MNANNQPMNVQPSGRIVNGYAAPYDFSISEVISEAWDRVSGSKAPIWGGLAFYLLVAIGLNVLISVITGTFGLVENSANPFAGVVISALSFITQILLYPLYAGILMLGIKRAVNLQPEAKTIFYYYSFMLRIVGGIILTIFIAMLPSAIGGVILGIVTTGAFNIGLKICGIVVGILFLGAGIYLAWCYIFAVQLIVEKDFGIWHALEASRKAVTQHWWKVFGLTFVLCIIYIISVIPLLLGLIWTLPLMIVALGVMYRRIFGVEIATAAVQKNPII